MPVTYNPIRQIPKPCGTVSFNAYSRCQMKPYFLQDTKFLYMPSAQFGDSANPTLGLKSLIETLLLHTGQIF